jgi:hypothetical protein
MGPHARIGDRRQPDTNGAKCFLLWRTHSRKHGHSSCGPWAQMATSALLGQSWLRQSKIHNVRANRVELG